MAKFAANNRLGGTQQAMAATFKSLLTASAATATLRRAWVNSVIFSADGTPADFAMVGDVSRITALGTATGVTPPPVDPADTAAGTVIQANATAEPTVTAASSLLSYALNVRATYRWTPVMAGQELLIPATNVNGLAFRALSPGYTGTAMCDIEFYE